MIKKKIAVILCGSGFRDGSEIRESVGVLWALSQQRVLTQCYAPDSNQVDVVNCLTGGAMNEQRNMLVEAARIARGAVKPLSELTNEVSSYDGVVLPGGFGVAKNLCTFAMQGSQGSVRPELQKILESFHQQKKPIGAVCIAPALMALAFKGKKLELTLGMTSEASREIEKLGHHHIECRAHQMHYDSVHKIASTPAYMEDQAELHDIFEGIRKTIEKVIQNV